jgi:hypothetical protein
MATPSYSFLAAKKNVGSQLAVTAFALVMEQHWKISCCVNFYIETKAMNVECFTSFNQLFLCFE